MKKNSMLSLITAAPAFVLLTVARFVQIAGGTDMETGFLLKDNGFLINFSFYGLMLVTLIAVTLLGILTDKKKNSSYYTNDISVMVDGRAVMLGFPLLLAGAMTAYEGYMQTQALTPSGFIVFIDFVFGAIMLILGFIVLYKKEISKLLAFSLVVPALYYTLRGIGVFLDRMAVASIPEYLIECFTIIGAAIFFMQLAKLLTGNETKHTRTLLCTVGLTTATATLANAVAVILADVIDPYSVSERITSTANAAEIAMQRILPTGKFGYHMAYTSWVDVIISVLMVLTLVAMFMRSKPAAEKTASENEESE